jgi:hypothetical protein
MDAGATDQDLLLAEKLLVWAQEHEHIYLRQVYQFGPHSIREAKTAKRLVSILEEHSWLIRVKGGVWNWMAHTGATRGGSGAMREYVKFNFDAEPQLQDTIPATPATPQEQSSESSRSSTEVPLLSQYCTPEERVQGSAAVERGDRHDGDRGLATVATPATQVRQSSGSSRSSALSPLDTRSTATPPCQPAHTGHRKDSSNAGTPQLIPVILPISRWPNSPGACYACGATRRWRSLYGVLICRSCHPPAMRRWWRRGKGRHNPSPPGLHYPALALPSLLRRRRCRPGAPARSESEVRADAGSSQL